MSHPMPTLEGQRYGLRLRSYREDLGWTREELAQKAGVTFSEVRALEYGYGVSESVKFKIVTCLEGDDYEDHDPFAGFWGEA